MSKSRYFDTPRLVSASDFLGGGDGEKFFYVPAYQRHFSWSNKKIDRLFEDILEDIGQRLVSNDADSGVDTVSFIGTALCYQNARIADVYPQVRDQVPEIVHTVIDGQQRMTVLIALAIILHDYIRLSEKGQQDSWLQRKCLEKMKVLVRMFRSVNPYGDEPVYPRMIRALDDQWSVDSQKKYRTPLSNYEYRYGKFLLGLNDDEEFKKKFKHDDVKEDPGDLDDRLRDAHGKFRRAVKRIKKWVDEICEGSKEAFPDVQKVFGNEELMEGLFNTSNVDEGLFDFADNEQHKTARALLLATYLNKVCFLSLVTKNERYAFNIFDSLNTTGEPLTAYETLRPEVIRKEGTREFRDSESRRHLETIDGHLEKESAEKKPKRTADFLITFALAENGCELSKQLYAQRKYLKEAFESCGSKSEAVLFTEHLMHVSDAWQLWLSKQPDILCKLDIEVGSIDALKLAEANFCLRFLIDAGHTISLALIARFYANVRILCDKKHPNHIKKAEEMCDIVKAVAAFFAVWRSSHPSTDGIENCYRRFVREEISRVYLDENDGNKRKIRKELPSLERVQQRFCGFLTDDGGNSKLKIGTKDIWINQSKTVPIYSGAKQVAKFVMLLAAHKTKPHLPDHPTRLKKVFDRVVPSLISPEVWIDDDYETVEHVCPQSYATGDVYNPFVLHRIGNLTLLPGKANSILSAKSWPKKRVIYKLLSAEDDDEWEAAASEARAAGIPDKDIENLRKNRYLPMTKTVAAYEEFYKWDEGKKELLFADEIEPRGKDLLKNAWILLSEWLNFKEGKSSK